MESDPKCPETGKRSVFLFHWHEAEMVARLERLAELGYDVDGEGKDGARGGKRVQADPPDAIVIDLARLPSHGRAMAWYLRERKRTRGVPLVIVKGEPAKTQRLQRDLPDAIYTTWRGIGSALKRALSRPSVAPVAPVVPRSTSGYSGKPLAQKLGVKPGTRLLLVGAPDGFLATLGMLPAGAVVATRAGGKADLVLLFAVRRAELQRRLPAALRALDGAGILWLAWPKKTSGVDTDLDEAAVREAGLAAGRIDFKVCAIDATWSGHAFGLRRSAR